MKRKDARPSGLIRKVVASLATIAMIGGTLILSVVLFVYLAIAAVIVYGCLRWETRNLRKQMNGHSLGGLVIEGEVINKSVSGV
ncbi:MAG: hypothetical protein Q7J38_10305 [Gallionella sp.]|nr:hypothetical protein [Gallionella sp.]